MRERHPGSTPTQKKKRKVFQAEGASHLRAGKAKQEESKKEQRPHLAEGWNEGEQ